MARKTHGEMFADSRGAPIRVGGLTIHGIHRIPVPTITGLTVRFVRTSRQVRQALRVTVDDWVLLVNGQTLRDIVLWADTAPRSVHIEATPSSRQCLVKMWNAWQDTNGVMQAWIGNCGMLVEQSPSLVRLQCSDGVDGPDFDDLVVEVALSSHDVKEGDGRK